MLPALYHLREDFRHPGALREFLLSHESELSHLSRESIKYSAKRYTHVMVRYLFKGLMMLFSFFLLLGVLMFFHFLADYPLQGEFLAKAKNHRDPIPGIPWYHALFAHSFIHAGLVFVATGSMLCFAGELLAHFIIDNRKCSGELTFVQDQYSHLACKILWAALIAGGIIA